MIALWFNVRSEKEVRVLPEIIVEEESRTGSGDGDPASIMERYPLFQARAT